ALSFITKDEQLANLITGLCTYDYILPQGFPTSNTIAEIVLIPLARRLNGLCQKYGLNMSIYIDDICISGSDVLLKLSDRIIGIFMEIKFILNFDKYALASKTDGVTVTGVYLKNNVATTAPEFDQKMISEILSYNLMVQSSEESFFGESLRKNYRRINSRLNWVKGIDKKKANKFRNLLIPLK
ncbi:MAG: hypothetical protein KKC80_04800, partial [Candidatus Margulisbacteria bacterium]|nr:hypothetical protein [Candidatus Margulisiibacteriota bacterium]